MPTVLDKVLAEAVTPHAGPLESDPRFAGMLPIERSHAMRAAGAVRSWKPEGTQVVSLDVLDWRKPFGGFSRRGKTLSRNRSLPVLGFFSPFKPDGKFSLTFGRWDSRSNTRLPDEILSHYNDIRDRLSNYYGRSNADFSVTYTATLTPGIIPPEIRSIVTDASEKYGRTRVWFLAEVTSWSVEETPRVVYDPLVVAWDGDSLVLLGKFDLTPVESYVAAEFATKS